MKKGLVYIFLFSISMLFPGCSDEPDDLLNSPPRVRPAELYIRVIGPDGTNRLDELGITPQTVVKKYYYNYPIEDNGEMNVVISKERDDVILKPSDIWWEYLLSEPGSSAANIALSEQEEMLMLVSWTDFFGDERFQESYDDAYIIKLKSAKIFGNEQEHTIRWDFHVDEGRYNFQATKCEVDGVNHPLSDDLYMNYIKQELGERLRPWDMRITGFITLVVDTPAHRNE